MDPQQTRRDVDTTFEIFAHHRRRYALRSLRAYGDSMTLADLADEVAVREHEAPITEIPGETVKRVYFSLYHTHVPKLAAEQFVRYDQERDRVTLTERAESVEQYRERLALD